MPNKSDIEISVHPNTKCLIEESLYYRGFNPRSSLVCGFRLTLDYELKPYGIECAKWIFPKDPFVTYEPSDEDWARYLRFGHEQPSRVKRGDVKLKREIPVMAFQHHTHPSNVRFATNRNASYITDYADRVGCETFTDPDYVSACRAVEQIDDMLMRFLTQEIGRAKR